nr:flavodoxin family protein [Syntrophaceae bacterium]
CMQILAFNGSPRPQGNTSAVLAAMLEGARSRGAEAVEIRLHDSDFKGGLGFEGVGRILHTQSADKPAASDRALLERAFDIGRKMVR